MTRFNDNWFDVMFDEAVEELEKENEKKLKKDLTKRLRCDIIIMERGDTQNSKYIIER